MAFTKQVWDQLKATTIEELISALERDGFRPDPASAGAVLVYIRKEGANNRRVVLHYHRGKTWSPKFLKGLFDDIDWKENDLTRVGLVKARAGEAAPPTYLLPCNCNLGVLENGQPCPECGGSRFREVAVPPVD